MNNFDECDQYDYELFREEPERREELERILLDDEPKNNLFEVLVEKICGTGDSIDDSDYYWEDEIGDISYE